MRYRLYLAWEERIWPAGELIDTTTTTVTAPNTVATTISGFSSPEGISIAADSFVGHVANIGARTVSVGDLPTNTIVRTIAVGSSPTRSA